MVLAQPHSNADLEQLHYVLGTAAAEQGDFSAQTAFVGVHEVAGSAPRKFSYEDTSPLEASGLWAAAEPDASPGGGACVSVKVQSSGGGPAEGVAELFDGDCGTARRAVCEAPVQPRVWVADSVG